MLQITIPISPEGWDERKEEFVDAKTVTLQLEHSLVSISKWESKWHKPFLSKDEKTAEETIDYIKCMTLTQNVKAEVYEYLTGENIRDINAYIEDSKTATTFSNDRSSGPNREIITSEVIYYWMVALNIPFECQKWHLNRLLTLIRVCNVKNNPGKKMNKKELLSKYDAINKANRKRFNTKG